MNQVHVAWLIRGKGQAVQNFIAISDPLAGGDLSVNANGYPADTRGTSLTMNSEDDCLDVWRAVLDASNADISGNSTGEYEATYVAETNNCIYTYSKAPSLTVDYNSNTGVVVVNN